MRNFVESLVRDRSFAPHVAHRSITEGRAASMAAPESGLPEGGRDALAAIGVEALYSHQAQALDRFSADENVLLATPTASGKTLAYLMAFLATRARDAAARAVFLYPLKALARDQLGVIRRVLGASSGDSAVSAEIYDGDTPDAVRRRLRKSPPTVLLTNPDMLHLGILPSHESWAPFLSHLRLIVVDEAHFYRGVFGGHVHHVLRRLVRLARHHGGAPQVMAGSATIGAPAAFIETLVGEPFHVVSGCGAPERSRHVVFMAPRRVSPYTLATKLVARCIAAGHKTIAFTKARRITELMHRWLAEQRPDLMSRVASYRSGYLPEERRRIERRLFDGELDGVISTSALEAGIDVGGLDVCILVGYPGSLTTSWQRIGRAGREDRESLAILVAMPDALDQYVVRHPDHFFSSRFERVVLDPENDAIADRHLVAAASEQSIDPHDVQTLAGAAGTRRVARLIDEGLLTEVHGEERWFSVRRRPQRDIALRSSGSPYVLRLSGSGRQLGTVDAGRVWFETHPGAIYLHAGRTYRALELDVEGHTVSLESCDVDYFTQVYARKETEILERTEERPIGPARLVRGRVEVTTFIEGFGKRHMKSQEEFARLPLDAPPQKLETTAVWIEFPRELVADLVAAEIHPAGALHAMEHALIGLFPLLAICDRWDLGGISYARHPQLDRSAVFIYDGWPGGIGLSETGFDRAEELFEKTRRLVDECSCEAGCPACIHSPRCGSGNTPLDKAGSVAVLDIVLGRRRIEASPADGAAVVRALATHRTRVHAGVRGGGAFSTSGEHEPAPRRGGQEIDGNGVPGRAEVSLDDVAWPQGVARPLTLLDDEAGRWLFFDLETLRSADEVGGWGRIREMGLALAVTLDAASGSFKTYREPDAGELIEDLLAADRVVGFNHERFDLTVLSAYGGEELGRIATLDLLGEIKKRIGFRLSLGHLAEVTLGAEKSASGLQSLEWVRQGRFDLIERYCRDDVMLTAALWAYGRQNGFVLFRSKKGDGLVGKIRTTW